MLLSLKIKFKLIIKWIPIFIFKTKLYIEHNFTFIKILKLILKKNIHILLFALFFVFNKKFNKLIKKLSNTEILRRI